MKIFLMRHGKTKSNTERRYLGRQNEALSEAGKAELLQTCIYPELKVVFVSSLRRTQETARLCFPAAEQIVVDGLEELDFGDFEGKTAAELTENQAYQSWVDSYCSTACPNGESIEDILRRTALAFQSIIKKSMALGLTEVVVVAHNGSIMAIMKVFSGGARDYFEWSVSPAQGWQLQIDPKKWSERNKFTDYQHFERIIL